MTPEIVACTAADRHTDFWRHKPPPDTWVCWLCHPCPLRPQSRLSDRQVGFWQYNRETRETTFQPLEWERREPKVPSVSKRTVAPSRPVQEVVVETHVKIARPLTRDEAHVFPHAMSVAFRRLGIERGEEFVLITPSTLAAILRDPKKGKLGPFSRDSDTSRSAALDNYPKADSQRRAVLEAIVDAGGLTREEIALKLRIRDSAADARVWELKQGDFVKDTDAIRKTQSGSDAHIVVATEKGLARDEADAA